MTSPAELDPRLEHYRQILTKAFGDKPWLIAMDFMTVSYRFAQMLGNLGAPMAICVGGQKPGDVMPEVEGIEVYPFAFDSGGDTMMTSIRNALDAAANLPQHTVDQIDALDPERKILSIGPIFDDGRAVAGRRKFGARGASWQALEDKTTIDALWDSIGIERPEAEVIHLQDKEALTHASKRIDLGHGVVWAGDFDEGFHGGGDGIRWIQSQEHFEQAHQEFSARFTKVRVTPFLEGLPCSIHAIVFPEKTIALKPCEMVVFHRPGHMKFRYSSAATFWDALPHDEAYMRRIAIQTGDKLRQTHAYRGVLTIDGVMTKDGFMPTELNPRFGAALHVLTGSLNKTLPLTLLNLALVEGIEADWQPDMLEALILERAGAHRAGSVMRLLTSEIKETQKFELLFRDGTFKVDPSLEDGEGDVHAYVAPHSMGGMIRGQFEDLPEFRGAPLAPYSIDVINTISSHVGFDPEPWCAAKDVRSESFALGAQEMHRGD